MIPQDSEVFTESMSTYLERKTGYVGVATEIWRETQRHRNVHDLTNCVTASGTMIRQHTKQFQSTSMLGEAISSLTQMPFCIFTSCLAESWVYIEGLSLPCAFRSCRRDQSRASEAWATSRWRAFVRLPSLESRSPPPLPLTRHTIMLNLKRLPDKTPGQSRCLHGEKATRS